MAISMEPAVSESELPPLPPVAARGSGESGRTGRRGYITKGILVALGATPGCRGCGGILAGSPAAPHSDRCRSRVEECMRSNAMG